MFNKWNYNVYIIYIVKDQSEKWLVYTNGFIIELLRSEKRQKCRIILSQHTNYLHKWLVHFLTCLLPPCLFFYANPYICKPRTILFLLWRAGPPGLIFYGSGLACLPSWMGMMNGGWLGSAPSQIFLQMKYIFFKGSNKEAVLKPWQPASYNQLLIQLLLLVQECYVEDRVLHL